MVANQELFTCHDNSLIHPMTTGEGTKTSYNN